MKNFLLTLLLLPILAQSQTEKGISPLPAVASAKAGQTYAVVVGISDYQDEGIPDLRFADKDAEAFANFLRSPAGGSLDEDHLKVLINEQATVAQFAMNLDWLWEVVQENDRVIIYFSGHGDVEKKSITQPGYLLCWDAPARVYLAGGAMNVRDLNDVVSTLSIQNKAKVVLITDACRAGKLSGSDIGGAQATASNLTKQYANEIKILSCQPDEYSIEGEQWGGGRGAFSYHLLEGLVGMADGNDDRVVNLKEISRYLEDRVSEEVAPHHQNPMTIGGVTEKLTDVLPDMLEQLKDGKQGQLQLFTPTESRGMEEEILAAVDTSVQELYAAFQQSIATRQFLEPEDACADAYYEQLVREPGLERLHSTMRRNYAAALQDEAQQVMNKWLSTDLREVFRSTQSQAEEYQAYPAYLERAASLLGEDHYMYPVLKARLLFFEGYILALPHPAKNEEIGRQVISRYREALKFDADLPHVYWQISRVFGRNLLQIDSAEYYSQVAASLSPKWLLPYTSMAHMHYDNFDNYDRARYYLEQAAKIDTGSALLRMRWGGLYNKQNKFEKAAEEYKKAMKADPGFIGNYLSLGLLNNRMGNFEEAKKYLLKAQQIDSTNFMIYTNLGYAYLATRQYEALKEPVRKSIELGANYAELYCWLGFSFFQSDKYEEATSHFEKALEMDSSCYSGYAGMASVHNYQGQYEQARAQADKAFQVVGDNTLLLEYLGLSFMDVDHLEAAEKAFLKIISLDDEYAQAYFNLARVYTLRRNPQTALVWLKKALRLQQIPYKTYKTDVDLDLIRQSAEFKALMEKYFPDNE